MTIYLNVLKRYKYKASGLLQCWDMLVYRIKRLIGRKEEVKNG
jgi:hypothetical protein